MVAEKLRQRLPPGGHLSRRWSVYAAGRSSKRLPCSTSARTSPIPSTAAKIFRGAVGGELAEGADLQGPAPAFRNFRLLRLLRLISEIVAGCLLFSGCLSKSFVSCHLSDVKK